MHPLRPAGAPDARGRNGKGVRPDWRLEGDQLALLRCPVCGFPLDPGRGDELVCASPACEASFPVVDGVPVLIGPSSIFARPGAREACYRKPSTSWLRDLVFRMTPDLELRLKRGSESLERETRALSPNPIRVLNIGGKHAGSAVQPLRSHRHVEILELDFARGPSTQLVADPARLPLADSGFDVVVIDSVLEHVPEPGTVVGEIERVLRGNGLVFSDTPFLIPVHGGAFDFGRFSQLAHRRLFSRFDEIESGISSGPALALCWSIQQFLLSFTRSLRARHAVKLFCRMGIFWIKYADHFLKDRPAAHDGAFAFYFLGRKSSSSTSDRDLLGHYRGNTPDLLA